MLYMMMCHTLWRYAMRVEEALSNGNISINRWPDGAPYILTHLGIELSLPFL